MTEQVRMEILKDQISASLENEAFCEAIVRTESIDELKMLLNHYNIDATLEEVTEIVDTGNTAIAKMRDSQSDELSEDTLEAVTGGGWWGRVTRAFGAVAIGAAGGFALGMCCGVWRVNVGVGVCGGV